MNLSKRSYKKELLDADDIPFEAIRQNMNELNTINSWLGGHAITINAVKKFIPAGKTISICEIGCGGGDNLYAVEKWCKKNNITASFTGIDIKQSCIDFAKNKYAAMNANWITSDYEKVNFETKPDIIFSSLFCHHFLETELVNMAQWMKKNCCKGFFINDLERNIIAYYAIKFLTRLFSKSYLVKHDAPLSVARGFKKKEWHIILSQANVTSYIIQWKWAFRHLVMYHAK
ncbi:MAG: methyltransferase domain-containing protein [Chitinophagaceae bacterium]|nr:methyltransferase domain-containing protein [Chitinophagaceae bacterium]